jgi:CRP-like cAMP-binding protein
MTNPLTMKLEQFTRFKQEERQRLNALLSYPTQSFARGETIIEEGEKVTDIHLILTGLAARSKTLADGSRQIMAFLIPGDLCDVEVFILEAMDHDIVAMSETTCVLVPADVMEELLTQSSNITRATRTRRISARAAMLLSPRVPALRGRRAAPAGRSSARRARRGRTAAPEQCGFRA